ncbi:rubrerythrin family protein [bacterium]|nr:rubrerythrin family protein [bacterium]
MDFMYSETRKNLVRSFAGESQARTRYTIYAQTAREENCEWIARVFEETAANEAVHAREFLEMLKQLEGCGENIDLEAGYPFQLGTTAENLGYAAEGELDEHDNAYPGFAEMARREGFKDAARLWMQIARIEGLHYNQFTSLREQLTGGTLTQKQEPIRWRCLNCGYTYDGIRACDPCPVCGKSAGWQEGELDRKKIMDK